MFELRSVSAIFENAQVAREVCVNIIERVLQRMSDSRLSGEMNDARRINTGERVREPLMIRDINLEENETPIFSDLRQPSLF